ncbi:MAG: sugar O-acetyltransferase [Demequinaceae bacterium]|nr:sugar O-acetyltransferase [Demequinaceae bacterium]
MKQDWFAGDPRTNKERMLAGDDYMCVDPELNEGLAQAAKLAARFNAAYGEDPDAAQALLPGLLGSIAPDTYIRAPLFVDYGVNITIGSGSFANYGLIALDVAPITIGNDVLIGPNVQFLTPSHPIDPERRRDKLESAKPIVIGNNVWLGGGVIVLGGVTIGENSIIGAGAVVTKDIPANVIAVGNPARVIREV